MRIRLSVKTSRVSLHYGIAALLMLAALVLAACGTAAEPESDGAPATAAPAATSPPTTIPATAASDPSQADTQEPASDAMLAAAFELPSGTGGNVSLASFAGDKNVVLVFYRGFW